MYYAKAWRVLHWIIAAGVLCLIPIGLLIKARTDANMWDALTNLLYSVHKSLGFTVLLLMLLRIGCKYIYTSPAYPESLPRAQVLAAKGLHHLLYALLVAVPLLGWAGVTAFPALEIVPGFSLPGMPGIVTDEALAAKIFAVHGIVAISLAVLLLGHIGAALYHLVVKKDGVFERMWFRRGGEKP